MSGPGETGAGAPQRAVIVGGGAAGWLAAAVLAQALRGLKGMAFQVVDLGAPAAPLAAATLPGLSRLHRFLGVGEDAAMAAARGSFRLGVQFDGWSGPSSSRFLAFGDVGASLGSVAFHQVLLRLERHGRPQAESDYALAALAAKAGRFTRPSEDPRSVLSTLACGLHLDQARYAEVLRARAEAAGVTRIQGCLARVRLREPDGAIEGLDLEDGRRVDGDLFIDCTGRDGLLIAGALGAGFEDWSGLTPFDRQAEALVPTAGAPEPFTRIVADDAGWLRRVPLQGASGLVYCYASQFVDPAKAGERLRAAAGGAVAAHDAPLRFGRRSQAWRRNCVALGEAAGSAGALPGVDLHLVQTGLWRLLSLFPFTGGNDAAAGEYNRLTAAEAERLRDFALVHYRTNGRRGDPAWDAARTGPLPDSLAYKIRLFESRARTPMIEEETFPESSWASVLMGQGVRSRRYDAQADAAPVEQVERTLERMRAAMAQAVQAMPTHAQYLAAHCPSSAPELTP
jgi:tryptophan halogenase